MTNISISRNVLYIHTCHISYLIFIVLIDKYYFLLFFQWFVSYYFGVHLSGDGLYEVIPLLQYFLGLCNIVYFFLDVTDSENEDEGETNGRVKRRKTATKRKVNEMGETPLHRACITGNLKAVRHLLTEVSFSTTHSQEEHFLSAGEPFKNV